MTNVKSTNKTQNKDITQEYGRVHCPKVQLDKIRHMTDTIRHEGKGIQKQQELGRFVLIGSID